MRTPPYTLHSPDSLDSAFDIANNLLEAGEG